MVENKNVDLFGGAMACKVPPCWRDVSDVRQIPDNQEVYQDCVEKTGSVLVIEILEYQSDVPNDKAASFFFQDLADANGCSLPEESRILSSKVATPGEQNKESLYWMFPHLVFPPTTAFCTAVGRQKIAQGKNRDVFGRPREIEALWVSIELCVLRLQHVKTDLLVTLSHPCVEKGERVNDNESPMDIEGNVLGDDEAVEQQHSNHFRDVLSSFIIRDWSLFDG